MKTITKERLLAAMIKLDRWRESELDSLGNLVCAAATLGLRAMFSESIGQPLPESTIQKGFLEMRYALDKPANPWDLLQMKDRYRYLANRHNHFRDRLYEIQEAHGVSGLEEDVLEIGGTSIKHPCGTKGPLKIIDSDIDILSRWKSRFLEIALKESRDRSLQWFKDNQQGGYCWTESSEAEIIAASGFYSWALVWESSDLDESPEINISFGNGPDIDSPEQSAWFRSSSHYPCL